MKNIIVFFIILLFSGCDDVFTDSPESENPEIGYRLASITKKTPFSEEVYYNMTFEYTYDSLNRLSEEKQSNKFYLFDCITTHSDDIIYYDYDEQNRLIKKTIFNLLQLDQSYYYTYEYSSNNRLILERKYNHYDELLEYIVYDYEDIQPYECTGDDCIAAGDSPDVLYGWYKKYIDTNGRMTMLEYYDEEGIVWHNTYTYESGLLKEVRSYNSIDSVNYYRKYTHDTSLRLLREEKYDSSDSLTEYFTHEYDSLGKCICKTQYDSADEVVSFITYAYEEYQK